MVYDGDTLLCDMDGNSKEKSQQSTKVRLLGIDSPEMHYSKKNTTGHVEPFARRPAHGFKHPGNRTNPSVGVRSPGKGPYRKNLAFVYPNNNPDVSLNEQMLAQGIFAAFLGANTRHKHRFETVEAQARHEKRASGAEHQTDCDAWWRMLPQASLAGIFCWMR
ncbi:MAG: thermonuclease family protein [Vampirovibrionales bacterium]